MSDQHESPSIADKLARLAELEGHFQRTLEAEKIEALAEFAAGAGHEINNPLTVISGRAQLLLREESNPDRKHALALISGQAMRIYEMIADMMLFARPPKPELQRVELVNLVDEVIVDLLPRCQRQETAIGRTGQSGPIFIEADPAQLNVALRAICHNSLEALQNGGKIEIEIETLATLSGSGSHALRGKPIVQTPRVEPGDAERREQSVPMQNVETSEPPGQELPLPLLVHIHDDGPGIAPEERQHIFDPFYSARQAGRGLGLGLSKAWRIVTNHDGRIEVNGQPGHGTTLTIVLPGDCRLQPPHPNRA
jgi:signal transduction histidine kinase